jgi:PAS domain S-box-containing protein
MSDREPRLPVVRRNDILDRITDAFFALDREWRFTYVNDRAEGMLDATRGELLGRVIWDVFPETTETGFPEGFRRAIESQEPVSFEVFHNPTDTTFEARAYPSETGLTVSLRDVTERRARQRDRERYEAVVETVRDGVLTFDEDDRITFANAAIEATLGMDRDQLVGEHVGHLQKVADIDAEGTADIGHTLDLLHRGDADRRRFEVTYTDADGRERLAETQMVPLSDGEVAGVVRDVTEQRAYERVVTSLHAITPELLSADDRPEIGAIAVHAAGEVLDLRISGVWLLDEEYNRLDPVAGTAGAHDELGGLPHFPRGEGPVWDAFRRDEAARYDDVDDDDTPLRSQIVVPIGDHGVLMAGETDPGAFEETDLELAAILAANTEAALDRADRDELLVRSKETLERQNQRLDVVETVLANDLRDHLAVAARRARAAGADGAVEPLMRARRLADDALELAKGEFSVGPRTALDLERAVETASDVVDGATAEVVDGASLRADRERFVRLIETFLLDARERSPEGCPVTVTVGVVDEATLSVTDDAPSRPPAERERAFELEHAGSFDREDRAGPTGLGLAVAGEIAAAHGWETGIAVGEEIVRFEIRDVTTLEPEPDDGLAETAGPFEFDQFSSERS